MERYFNTAGPIRKEDHYCIDPLHRVDLEEILLWIAQKKYFVLHAPRQAGKTSLLLALMELTYTTQIQITQEAHWYTGADGRLDMDKLLTAFQDFFRKHFDVWIESFDYREAGPHLLLQAFLQRLVNSGGRVDREYGFGRMRTDLLVTWPCKGCSGGRQEVVLELKLRYGSLETTIEKGLKQTREYMDKCGTDEGYLLIFNRSPNASWDEKIFKREETYKGVKINVYGI